MLYDYSTEKLLGLQGVLVKKIAEDTKSKQIYIELKRKTQICPRCGKPTDRVQDYRNQTIKDVPAFGKFITLILKKRRYRCTACGKRFVEDNSFLPRYYRMTNRLAAYVIDKLRSECSFTSVSRQTNLSVSTVIRIFDYVSYPKGNLSKAIAIDEFKGNTGGEKYNTILTDLETGCVLDILSQRKEAFLCQYFKQFPKEERERVEYFISDMWTPFASCASTWFKNAKHVVDKYHWIRQCNWAFEGVRKEVQQTLGKERRIYFKHSRKLLLKRFSELKEEDKQAVQVMLYMSPRLCAAHRLKEHFLSILDCPDRDSAKKKMSDWLMEAEQSGIKQFENCAGTLHRWSVGILNSFSTQYTNGFTEGCNNKIKVLKRNAYGYTNFRRFRNRILHMFSHQLIDKKAATV